MYDEENENQEGEQKKQNVIVEQAKRQAEEQAKKAAKKAVKEAGKAVAKGIKAIITKNPYVLLAIAIIIAIIVLILVLIPVIQWFLDQNTVAEAGKFMTEDISQYVSIQDGHFEIDESIYQAFLDNWKAQGLEDVEYLKKDSKYLKAIIQAELATSYPKLSDETTNLEDNSFQGIVQIIRRSYEAEDREQYYNGGQGDNKELLLEYMKPEEFDQKVDQLKGSFSNSDYEKLRRYYTIGGEKASETSGSASSDGGSDAEGNNGLIYDATFATLTKTPEELGLTVANEFSSVRTTVYCACEAENGVGNAGKTSAGIDLEPGRHLIAILDQKFGLEYGDWVYIQGKGYYQVCDVGEGFENRMDVFYGKEGDSLGIGQDSCPQASDMDNRQNEIGNYNDVKIIKKAEAEAFIQSGYVRDSSTAGNTNESSRPENNSSIKIKIVTYNGNSVGTEEIAYQNNVNKYSVPVEFLIAQLQVTDNPEYIYDLADMVINNSKIELVIQDTKTTTTTTTITNTATTNESGETVVHTGTPTSTTTVSYGRMKYIREVDTWIVHVTQQFSKQNTITTTGELVYDQVGTFTETTTERIEFIPTPSQTDDNANQSIETTDG